MLGKPFICITVTVLMCNRFSDCPHCTSSHILYWSSLFLLRDLYDNFCSNIWNKKYSGRRSLVCYDYEQLLGHIVPLRHHCTASEILLQSLAEYCSPGNRVQSSLGNPKSLFFPFLCSWMRVLIFQTLVVIYEYKSFIFMYWR